MNLNYCPNSGGMIIKWKSEIISGSFKAEGYNLGIAHGIPSILLFLSKLAPYPAFNKQCIILLEPACNYLLSCKHTNKNLTASFPNWVIDNEQSSFNSRLAWCYGDLGVGIALLQTAKAINKEAIYSEAVSILSRSTQRKNAIEAGIKDPGLCHGSYGVMNIYLQVFKMSNEYIFKDSTDLWIESSLDMIGFETKNKDFAGIETNLLNGIPGIGLAIMSYLDNAYSRWKEAFLII